MSFMDVIQQNQQSTTGAGQSFTQQATQMQQALTGKSIAPASIQKSNIAEQTATDQAKTGMKQELTKAQGVQQEADLQTASIAQKDRENDAQYQRKRYALVSDSQHKLDEIYSQITQNYSELDQKRQASALQQIEFYTNLTDQKYMDQIQVEGDKRRLDDNAQMKEALMYATFSDNISLLKQNEDFQAAFNADDRSYNLYLAGIRPEFAIGLAVQEYKNQQSAKAIEGAGVAIASSAKGIGEGAVKWYNK